MGWGNIGLSWTRYARSAPTTNCERCHLDYAEAADRCPYCSQMNECELQQFLQALEAKRRTGNKLFIAFITALVLYVVVILFILPLDTGSV